MCTVCSADYSDVENRLLEVIKYWKRNDINPSWECLAIALGSIPSCGLAFATKFRQAIVLPAGNACYTLV